MEFVRIFWKNNVQEAYLPKMSISGQIVSEMSAGYTQKTPYKPFKYFFWVDPKKFRKVCMEFSKHNWAKISETICPEMLIFGPLASIILCLTSPKLYLATFKLFLIQNDRSGWQVLTFDKQPK